jgi:hypothetical protein
MKYNLSDIMKKAWIQIRNGFSKSEALKQAWFDAKEKLSYFKWKPFFDHKRDIVANKYNLESCDVENNIYLWFTKVIEKYDSKKSGIFTFLKIQFRGFETQLQQKLRKQKELYDKNIDFYIDPRRERFETILMFYDEIDRRLSENAKQILEFVFRCEWSPRKIKDPTQKISREAAIRYFHNIHRWTVKAVKEAWQEIKIWWREFQYA